MKKIVCAALALIMALSMTACWTKNYSNNETMTDPIEAEHHDTALQANDTWMEESEDVLDQEAFDYDTYEVAEQPEIEVPETVDYKMACLVDETYPEDSYWHAHQAYAIEILDTEGNDFAMNTSFLDGSGYRVVDTVSGEEVAEGYYSDDAKKEFHSGKICLSDIAHYGATYWGDDVQFVDQYDADKDILVIELYSKNELPAPEDVQITFPVRYRTAEGSFDRDFAINAQPEELTVNAQPIVHAFNPCLFGSTYYIPEINSSGYGDSDDGTCEGHVYEFTALTQASTIEDKEVVRERFVPVRWNADTQEFEQIADPVNGYTVRQFRSFAEDSDELTIGFAIFDSNGENVRSYDEIGTVYPAYVLDDGSLMCFAW